MRMAADQIRPRAGRLVARGIPIAAVALLLLTAGFGSVSSLFPARRATSGPIYTPSQVRDGLRRHPTAWIDRTILVRGTIGGECPPPPGGGVLNTENCALPPAGAPLFWISDGSRRPLSYDPRRSLGLQWVWSAPPAPAHPQWVRAGVYPVHIHIATPCPEEEGPRICVLGAINVGR